jgi:hypothetical protein
MPSDNLLAAESERQQGLKSCIRLQKSFGLLGDDAVD